MVNLVICVVCRQTSQAGSNQNLREALVVLERVKEKRWHYNLENQMTFPQATINSFFQQNDKIVLEVQFGRSIMTLCHSPLLGDNRFPSK